jgi:hypothetical protein
VLAAAAPIVAAEADLKNSRLFIKVLPWPLALLRAASMSLRRSSFRIVAATKAISARSVQHVVASVRKFAELG